MRYRKANSVADISGDISVVMDFIGVDEYRESLSSRLLKNRAEPAISVLV
jgi:hypothetical protein